MAAHQFKKRDDDLQDCEVCGGAEGSLLDECPGVLLTQEQHEANYAANGERQSKRTLLLKAITALVELIPLTRPMFILDTETTGRNPTTDRICSLHFTEIKPNGEMRDWYSLVNPTVPIPKEASFGEGGDYEGHGITDAMVADKPTFASLADSFFKGFQDCDYGGYNLKGYDLPLIREEFKRTGREWNFHDARILDGYRLWSVAQGRTLTDAVREFLGEDHTGAHGASADVHASLRVLVAQLQRFAHLPRDLGQLHELCWPRDPNAIDPEGKIVWKDGHPVVNFSAKWRGKRLDMMTKGDLEWIVFKATGISTEVKAICRNALQGQFPKREETAA